PPVPVAEEGDEGGDEEGADDRGVEEDAGGEAGGEDLDFGFGAGGEREEGEEEDEGGAGDEASGAAEAGDDGGGWQLGAVGGLAEAGAEEDLVVHREGEEDREHEQRDVDDERAGGADAVDELGAVALLPDEDEDAAGGGEREQVEEHRLEWQQERAEGAGEQDERDERDQAEHEREVAVDGGDEVAGLRRLTADHHAGRRLGDRAHLGEQTTADAGAAVGAREHVDDPAAVSSPGASGWRGDELRAGQRVQLRRQ